MQIAIIGAGKFGRAVARLLDKYLPGVSYALFDREANEAVRTNLEDIRQCKWVIPAVPISAFAAVLKRIALLLPPGSTVVDVCTVKKYPVRKMQEILPETVQLVASHPLFGPETLERRGYDLAGLPFVIWPARVADAKYQKLKRGLKKTGLNVLEMPPEEHDRLMARSQFITLLTGNLLKRLNLQPTPIDTYSFSTLLEVCAVTGDDFEILRDVYRFNPQSQELLEQFKQATEEVLKELRGGKNLPADYD